MDTELSAFLTADEGHAIFGKDKISRRSFYNALERKEIPCTKIGRRILIPRHAFTAWLRKRGALNPQSAPFHRTTQHQEANGLAVAKVTA
jgi:excisionase family DNA binding protein